MNKDDKLFNKFKKRYSFVFHDSQMSKVLKTHFDKRGSFIVFTIAFIENVMGKKQIYDQIKINKDEWITLFLSLYNNEKLVELYKKLEINPIVPLEHTVASFNLFNPFIESLFELLKSHEINLNIHESDLRILFTNVFGYIFYNCIDCKLAYDFKDILTDPEYDTKYLVVLNNTKLFSKAKESIVQNCNEKINDLIVLLLGSNKSLNIK